MKFLLDNLRYNNVNFERKRMNKIVNVYQEHYLNAKAQGLGDFIRGSYCLYQLCKKFNVEFEMNVANHPLSKFLNNNNIQYPQHVYNKTSHYNEINLTHISEGKMVRDDKFYGKIVNYLNKLEPAQNGNIFIGCNSFPIWSIITSDARQYVKSVLNPNDELKQYIDNTLSEIGLKEKEYSVIHVRCGDKFINSNNLSQMSNYNKILNIIHRHINNDKQYIILSDSVELKKIFQNRSNIHVYLKKITHMGENFVKTDETVKNTLLDFFIMSKAKDILSISNYSWGSGFSEMCALTYNVPLQKKILLGNKDDIPQHLKTMGINNNNGNSNNNINININKIYSNSDTPNSIINSNQFLIMKQHDLGAINIMVPRKILNQTNHVFRAKNFKINAM